MQRGSRCQRLGEQAPGPPWQASGKELPARGVKQPPWQQPFKPLLLYWVPQQLCAPLGSRAGLAPELKETASMKHIIPLFHFLQRGPCKILSKITTGGSWKGNKTKTIRTLPGWWLYYWTALSWGATGGFPSRGHSSLTPGPGSWHQGHRQGWLCSAKRRGQGDLAGSSHLLRGDVELAADPGTAGPHGTVLGTFKFC